MKKIIAVVLALLLCLSLFSCGKGNENKDEVTSAPTEAATTEPTATAIPTAEPTKAPQYYGKENLALDKPVEVDAVEPSKVNPTAVPEGDEEPEEDVDVVTYEGKNAVDGDYETRWSGLAPSDAAMHFIKIDLEKTYKIGFVAITWESCTSSFYIELLNENGERVEYKYCDAPVTDDIELYTQDYFNGKEARYVVVHIVKTAYGSPYEIEVYEQLLEKPVDENEKKNLAIGATATSDWAENVLTAEKAIDGDITTRWAPGGKEFTEDVTWTLDLGEVKKIDEIVVFFESNEVDYRIEIATDANGPWETVYQWIDTDIAGKTPMKVGGKDARFVRYLRPAGTSGWCSFYEVEVYGVE